MSLCLTDEEILAFVEGGSAEGKARVIDHVDECETCRRIVAGSAPQAPLKAEAPAEAGGLAAGSRVGRFLVVGPLGRGGMGVIYRALDERLGRPVALKLLNAERAGDGLARARFLREARTASTIDHPNIGTVYEVGEHEGQPFIAMALYPGESLRERLQRGPPTVDEVVSIANQLAEGLTAAHAAGVVHRDLKPANVMLLPDGQVKLLDFGLAKVTSSDDESSLTRDGAILGTLAYMAPEQLRGSASVDERADLWSLGAVLYELLGGRPPFGGGPATTLISSVLGDAPPPLPPSVPPDLAAVTLRLLEKLPQRRIASAAEVARLLARRQAPPLKRRALYWLAVALSCAVILCAALLAPRVAARFIESKAPPLSANPEAAALYTQALREYHEGLNTAYLTFDRALALDGGLAAASLHGAEICLVAGNSSMALQYYQNVLAHLDRLTANERAIAVALEPALVKAPPDWVETERRLRAALPEFSDDSDLALMRVHALMQSGQDAEARAGAQAIADAHPALSRAWYALGLMAINQSRYADASAVAERCVRLQPRATLCLSILVQSESLQGHCSESLAQSRRWIAVNPEDRWGYSLLAGSLEAIGASAESVDEAVRLANEHQQGTPAMRQGFSQLRLSSLAVRRGDLVAADRHIVDFLHLRLPHSEIDGEMISRRVELAIERGDDAEAARLAEEQLRLNQAFPEPELVHDPTPFLLSAERNAGTITRPQLEAAMADWRRRWRGEHGASAWQLWSIGEAPIVATQKDAEAAIARRPPLDLLVNVQRRERIARVSLLAGRLDEVAMLLERITKDCNVLADPVGLTRAMFDLAQTRERQGHIEAACGAYAKVLERWGKATPHSVTAASAAVSMERLRCGSLEK